jgi:signal transduction histidine kinase
MTAPSASELRIVVADDGAGFNPAEPRQDRAMATGFGLFSIRERLEMFGGRMEVDATVGRGTRVAITAPSSTG